MRHAGVVDRPFSALQRALSKTRTPIRATVSETHGESLTDHDFCDTPAASNVHVCQRPTISVVTVPAYLDELAFDHLAERHRGERGEFSFRIAFGEVAGLWSVEAYDADALAAESDRVAVHNTNLGSRNRNIRFH